MRLNYRILFLLSLTILLLLLCHPQSGYSTGIKQNIPDQYEVIPVLLSSGNEQLTDPGQTDMWQDQMDRRDRIKLRLTSIPEGYLALESIASLSIEFTDSIHIPPDMSLLKIGALDLKGNVSVTETDKLLRLFPDTELKINGMYYYASRWKTLFDDDFRQMIDDLWQDTYYEIVEILNINTLHFPVDFPIFHIGALLIHYDKNLSVEDLAALHSAFPETEIHVNGHVVHSRGYYKWLDRAKRRLAEWQAGNNKK